MAWSPPSPASARALAALALLAIAPGASAGTIRLDPGASAFDLEPVLEVYQDSSGSLAPTEVRAAPFRPHPGRAGLLFPEGALWVRATLENPSDEPRTWFLTFDDPLLRRVDVWLEFPGGAVHRRGGYRVPPQERSIAIRGPWHELPLVLLAEERVELVARLEAPGPIYGLARVVDGAVLGEDLLHRLVRQGVQLGLLLALAVLNLYSFLALRERGYLAFLAFALSFAGLEVTETGLASAYLFPDWPWLAGRAPPFFAGLALHFALHFGDAFLGVRPGRAARAAALLPLVASGVAIWSSRMGNLAVLLASIPVFPVLLSRTASALRSRTRSGWFFTVAMAPLIPAAAVFALTTAGLLPGSEAGRHLVHVAFAFTAFVVAFALADRVRTADEQARAGLERAVSARTAELATTVEALRREAAERLAAEAARRESEEKLRHSQRLEAVGRLAGGIAHDYNNLLTSVTTNLSILRMSPEPPPAERRQILDDVGEAADRGAALTRQLLAFSRRQVLSPQPLDVNRVVEGFRRLLDRLLGEGCELRLELGDRLPAIVADPSQVEQVLMNLVVNARDAMPSGGTITVSTEVVELGDDAVEPAVPGRFVRLSVSDTGTGIAPEVYAHVFEPFFTTKAEGKGTGLGLATVHGIVSQHSGFIDVDPGPGRGAIFRAHFPAADVEAVAVSARRGDASSLVGGTETVLLVEDERTVREGTRRLLQRLGYQVHAARDAADALRFCERAVHIDLVITDVVMPGMDGFALAERVRARCPHVGLLLTSGYAPDLARDGRGSGHAFLAKPYRAADLAARIRELLDGRPAGAPEPALRVVDG